MAQGERRAKAVLAAAVAWADIHGKETTSWLDLQEKVTALADAVAKYKLAGAEEKDHASDPMAFRCPHCDAPKPGYGWHFNAGDTGPFAVAYLTCFCGECKAILSVAVTTFRPAKELAEQLMKQFAATLVKPV